MQGDHIVTINSVAANHEHINSNNQQTSKYESNAMVNNMQTTVQQQYVKHL